MSTLIQEDLKLSLMVAAAWRDVAQLKGEGAAFVESKVRSLVFQFWHKCCFINVFIRVSQPNIFFKKKMGPTHSHGILGLVERIPKGFLIWTSFKGCT